MMRFDCRAKVFVFHHDRKQHFNKGVIHSDVHYGDLILAVIRLWRSQLEHLVGDGSQSQTSGSGDGEGNLI